MNSVIDKINNKKLLYIQKNTIDKLRNDVCKYYPTFVFICLDETDDCYILAKGINNNENAGITTLSFNSNTGNKMDFIRLDFDSRLIAKNKIDAITKYLALAHPTQSIIINEDHIYETFALNDKPQTADDIASQFANYLNTNCGLKDLDAILVQHPTLTAMGFDNPGNTGFQFNRAYLRQYVGEFQCACIYLSRRKKSSMRYNFHNSYTLKHIAEDKFHTYICNGALIAAAMHLGFEYRQMDPNAFFYMTKTEYFGL
jgi:hypothetical protein